MPTLKFSQLIKSSLPEVWDFFSSPANLSKITPPQMNFEIKEIEGRETDSGMSYRMYEGQHIRYMVTVLPLIRLTWVTEITHVIELESFIDEQLKGPYSLWRHLHTFEQTADGVMMRDQVDYAIPLGILGKVANSIFVEREVKRIFDYRLEAVERIFHNKS